jgi:hypothetical protein
MPSEEHIAIQWDLLMVHRRTLAAYLKQQALAGGVQATPVGVTNGIAETRASIARIKGILRGWGVTVEDQPDDEELPSASESALEPEPGMWQRARVPQLPSTTIIGDGNVIGDRSSSQVIKIESGIALELPADRLKYLDALQRMHAIIANLAPALLPEFQEYGRSIRAILEQDSQHVDPISQAEWAGVVERLNDLVRRAGLNISLHHLIRP